MLLICQRKLFHLYSLETFNGKNTKVVCSKWHRIGKRTCLVEGREGAEATWPREGVRLGRVGGGLSGLEEGGTENYVDERRGLMV